MALRLARHGSLLVHRRAFAGDPPPWAGAPFWDDLVWSASLLRDELGVLVPQSVVVREAGGPRPSRVGPALRLLTGDALAPRERPWFAFRLAEEAIAAVRGGRARDGDEARGAARRAPRG